MRDATVTACAVISLLVAACATVEPSASIPPSAAPSLTPDYETLPEDTVMIVWPIQHESRDPYPDLVVNGFGPAGDVRFHAVVPRSGQAEDAPGMPFPGLIVGSHHLASVRRSEYGGPVLQVLVYDLTNPTAGPAWTFSASGAWPGPRGLLAIRSDDWRRMTVLDIRASERMNFLGNSRTSMHGRLTERASSCLAETRQVALGGQHMTVSSTLPAAPSAK